MDLLILLLMASALASCGGGNPVHANGGGSGVIAGLVVKGPVQAATVTVYQLDPGMNRGTALANAPTMPDGTFRMSVPPYNGALELVAFGGTYPEEAVGVPVQLTHEFSFVIPAFQSGSSVSATISPVSSIVRSLAKAAIGRGASLSDAVSVAWTHCNNHFGGLDWRTVIPTSLTPSQKTNVSMSEGTTAGLILAGISQAARTMAETSSLSPGTSITGGTLSGSGGDDAADGTLDGMGGGVALVQGSVTLSSYTFRRTLGQAIVKFVGTSYNNTQLTAADVMSLANALAADSDPYLFCPNQTAAVSCAGGSLQLDPPTISFVNPPSFVAAAAVTLQATAADAIAPVTAVYAQTVGGSPVAGTFSAGVWTLPNVALVEGPNLIYVWGVDAAGTGSIANASQITVTRDTLPVTPYVLTTTVSYYDERAMTLTSGAVPPTYAFPGDAVKMSPIVGGGAYKASTRLAWSSQPTATILEGTNPDNVPFVQFALPVSPTRAPTTAASYSIGDGTNTYTGDLMPWKSSTSTSAVEYYDVPLSANIIPSLATLTTSPINLALQASFTNAAGTSGTTSTSVTFHVVGAPLWVALDSSWPTANDSKSTYAYTLAGSTYSTLWNTSSAAFYGGQVRLLRYVITNPAPAPVAVSAAVTQDVNGSWRAVETWLLFDHGLRNTSASDNCACISGASYTLDGFTFFYVTQFGNANSCIDGASTPCTTSGQTLLAHPSGSTSKWSCVSDGSFNGSTANWGGAAVRSSSSITADFFQYTLNAGENAVANTAGGNTMYIVPAASGSTPGLLTLYVERPVGAARSPALAWNAYTSGNRYESYWGDFFPYANFSFIVNRCSSSEYYARIGGIWLSAAEEQLYGTLNLNTRGLAAGGNNLAGDALQRFSTSWSGTVASH